MSRKRPITDFPRNEPGLVDNFIGTSYDVVKDVYLNLDSVVKVSEEIDNLPETAKQIFEESVDLYMPNVENIMDKYVESKKPEIDTYVETSKDDITNHTNNQKVVVDKAIQDASVDMSNQLEDNKATIQAISDEASTYSDSAKESARLAKLYETGSKQSADNSILHADNAKKEAEKSEASAKQSETALGKTLSSEASAKKYSDAAELNKDITSSFATSADYSQKEAYRSEMDVKNKQGEINLKSLEVERNTKLTSENREATLKFRNESEGFRDQSLVSKDEAEYWANKALENSGMDTSAFIGKSDVVGIKGSHTTRIIHQKAMTEFLNEKRDHKDTDFVEVTVDGFLIKKSDTNLSITKDEETLTLPNKGTLITEDTVNSHLIPISKSIEELENSKQDKLTFTGEGDVLTKDIIIDSLDDSNNLPTSKAVKEVTDQFIPKTDIAFDLGDSNDLPISQLAVKSAIEEVTDSVYSKSNSYSSSEIDTKLLTKVDKTSITTETLGDTDNKVPSEKLVKTSITNYHDASKLDISNVTQSFGNSPTLVGSQALVTGLNNQITNLNTTTNSLKTNKADTTYVDTELGKKMDDGAYGLGNNLNVPENDLNNAMRPGFYKWETGVANAPVDWGSAIVTSWQGTGSITAEQLVLKNGSVWARGKNNASADWTPWHQLATTSNIPSLSGYATQSWVNGRGFTTLSTSNANSSKLGEELRTSTVIDSTGAAIIGLLKEVPPNSVVTRAGNFLVSGQLRDIVYYRPIVRL